MKILVIGSNGMLGRDVVNRLKNPSDSWNTYNEVAGLDHGHVDIASYSSILMVVGQFAPDIIINCAAFTDVDACEIQVSEAFAVNAAGARNVAQAGKAAGAKIIHISTDYVFDGTKNNPYVETDKPNPVSIYGKSKLKGELAVQELTNNYAIIRTAWLFGSHRDNFVTTMLALGEKNKTLSVVTDQIGSPTYTIDLSDALRTVIKHNLQGIYHITNTGSCSRYEWARKIFELTGDCVSVLPIRSSDYKRPAPVPQNASLDCTKYTLASGQKMRPWDEALKEYLNKITILKNK